MTVNFYELTEDMSKLKYVVIQARYNGKWIFVRHNMRTTWEIPGGHIEPNETTDEAARRELWEECGAVDFKVLPLCDYAVDREGTETFGRLYFAEVDALEDLPDYEIEEIMFSHDLPINLTYLEIQPYLFDKVAKEMKDY